MFQIIKLPILKKGEYDIWAMKKNILAQIPDYPIWEVIQNRNGPVLITTDMQGQIKASPLRMQIRNSLVKGSTESSLTSREWPFVSENTSSTNNVSTAYGVLNPSSQNSQYEQTSSYSLLANQSSCPQLDHEDLEQLEEFDLKEIRPENDSSNDFLRMKKIDKRHIGHFARECRTKGNQDSKRRDAWNSGNKDGRRSSKQEDSKALVTIDGEGVDWTSHSEEEEDYALMACNSSGSNTEVISYSKECKESYAELKKLYDKQRAQLSDASIEILSYTQALKKVEAQIAQFVAHQPRTTLVHTAEVNAVRAVGKKGKLLLNPQQNKGVLKVDVSTAQDWKTSLPAENQDFKWWPLVAYKVVKMCDKKNKVLFTDTGCLVLSLEFKLPDENQVLLRIPRQNNMYNFNLENIVPSGGLAYLIAKATINESNKWHRRLGHVNFKNLNKLMKGNLVRGLPSKIFQNDHTCVACQKGKQHKASCKAKSVNSLLSDPYNKLLQYDLFGPTSIRSFKTIKTYCQVHKKLIQNAGTKDIIDAGDSEKEAESAHDYFVLLKRSSYTSTVKSSKAGKVTPLFASMLVQPTEDEGATSERPSEPQPTPSPPHPSEANVKPQSDPSPKPLPTPHIPDSFQRVLVGIMEVTDQAKEIKHLKAQIKKLKKKAKPNQLFDELVDDTLDYMDTENAQDMGRSRFMVHEEKEREEKKVSTEDVVSTNKDKVSTDKEKVSTDRSKVSTDRSRVSTDKEEVSTDRPDEGTDDQTEGRTNVKFSREKEKGVELKDVEETERPRPTSTRSLLTLKPLPKIDPKDKGKKKIKEEDESDTESEGIPEAEKKFKQLARDEEMARKVQEDWEVEKKLKSLLKKKRIKTAFQMSMILSKARIEADRLLALRLQDEEREQFTVEEKQSSLHEYGLRSKKVSLQNKDLVQKKKEEKGGHIKMLARKRKRPQSDVDSDDEHKKCLKIITFEGTINSEIMERKSVIARLKQVSSPYGDYLWIVKDADEDGKCLKIKSRFIKVFGYILQELKKINLKKHEVKQVQHSCLGEDCWELSIPDLVPLQRSIQFGTHKSILCPICGNAVELSRHLFFTCRFSSELMRKISRWWDIDYMEISSYEEWLDWILNL
ncbi:putative ribonuclease H-like domain-containing protein [Tanacetum coccineum]